MTILRQRIACWITKATDTHSEYVILIAFALQQLNAPLCHVIRAVQCIGCVNVSHVYFRPEKLKLGNSLNDIPHKILLPCGQYKGGTRTRNGRGGGYTVVIDGWSY